LAFDSFGPGSPAAPARGSGWSHWLLKTIVPFCFQVLPNVVNESN
jgi:hypothetical protein